eukprot:1246185-Pleurochrysis_carterae.AAC.1
MAIHSVLRAEEGWRIHPWMILGGTTSKILAVWTWPVWIACRGPSYDIAVRKPHFGVARAVARVVRVHPSHSDSV